jgi:hypothetical protein
VGNLGVGGGGAGAYGFRTGGGRRRAAFRHGGCRKSEQSVDDSLRWLVRNQEPNGSWGLKKWGGNRHEDGHVGITGLALLAFLGAGHTEKTGRHKEVVKKAVSYLISKQDGQGSIGNNNGGSQHGSGYNQAMAGLALAEAFGMARVPKTGEAAQKAIDYTTNIHQNEYYGWRYNPKIPPDNSVSGWFIMQLKSAMVAGLRVDGRAFQGAIKWFDAITKKPKENPQDGDETYYMISSYQPGRGEGETHTAIAMLGYMFCGWKRTDPMLIGGANYLVEHLPSWGTDAKGAMPTQFYYWYYGTLVMFQMGGEWWKQWNAALRDMLISKQYRCADPRLDGSWDPISKDGKEAGRAYSTAMGCLCLEVYYRYLPMYK